MHASQSCDLSYPCGYVAVAKRPAIHFIKQTRRARDASLVYFWQYPATVVCVNAAVSEWLADIQQIVFGFFFWIVSKRKTNWETCESVITRNKRAVDCNSFFKILSPIFHFIPQLLGFLVFYTFAFVISTLSTCFERYLWCLGG